MSHLEFAPTQRLAAGRARAAVEQLYVLTFADLRARYGRGGWQLVKWLIDPFALVGVYVLLVRFIFYRRLHAAGVSLACSVIPFQLVTMTVNNSLGIVKARKQIVGNMRFKRVLLPASAALTETFGFGASLAVLAVTMAVYGVTPKLSLLWLPLVLLEVILFGAAVAYPASLVGLWAPDMRGLVLSLSRATYYLAPGFVALTAIHGQANALVRINPMTGLFEDLRHAVIYGTSPPAWELLYPLAVALVLLAVFVPIYKREQAHFAKVIG